MRELAQRHRLKCRRAEDGEVVIPGKRGFIYRHSEDLLGWALVYDYRSEQPSSRWKEMAKQDPLLHLEVEGDEEAIFLFNPDDLPSVARQWCKARFRRRARQADLVNLSKTKLAPTRADSSG